MRVFIISGQPQSLPWRYVPAVSTRPWPATVSSAAHTENMELSVWMGQWGAEGGWSVSASQVKEVGGDCELAQGFSPWRQPRQLSCQQREFRVAEIKSQLCLWLREWVGSASSVRGEGHVNSKSSHSFSLTWNLCIGSLMWMYSKIYPWSSSVCEDAHRLRRGLWAVLPVACLVHKAQFFVLWTWFHFVSSTAYWGGACYRCITTEQGVFYAIQVNSWRPVCLCSKEHLLYSSTHEGYPVESN